MQPTGRRAPAKVRATSSDRILDRGRHPPSYGAPQNSLLDDMATAADDVPRQFDKIEVLFELDDGTFYWWPATVLDTTDPTRAGTVNGTATVEFASRQ